MTKLFYRISQSIFLSFSQPFHQNGSQHLNITHQEANISLKDQLKILRSGFSDDLRSIFLKNYCTFVEQNEYDGAIFSLKKNEFQLGPSPTIVEKRVFNDLNFLRQSSIPCMPNERPSMLFSYNNKLFVVMNDRIAFTDASLLSPEFENIVTPTNVNLQEEFSFPFKRCHDFILFKTIIFDLETHKFYPHQMNFPEKCQLKYFDTVICSLDLAQNDLHLYSISRTLRLTTGIQFKLTKSIDLKEDQYSLSSNSYLNLDAINENYIMVSQQTPYLYLIINHKGDVVQELTADTKFLNYNRKFHLVNNLVVESSRSETNHNHITIRNLKSKMTQTWKTPFFSEKLRETVICDFELSPSLKQLMVLVKTDNSYYLNQESPYLQNNKPKLWQIVECTIPGSKDS